MQSDYFGSAGAESARTGSVRARPDSPDFSSARKVQRRSSSESSSANRDENLPGNSSVSGLDGPPYICPTCSTEYSRLEYLRRHERRHADIRPFVCDCGKGFSRSDVLSRHKRQCRVVLENGEGGGQAPEPKAAKPRRPASTAKPGRPKGSTKAAKAAAAARANGHTNDGHVGSDINTDGPAPPPPAPGGSDQSTHDTVAAIAAAAAAAVSGHHHRQSQDQDVSNMIDPAISADSQAQAATTAAAMNSVAAYQYANPMDPPDFHMGRGASNTYASASFPHGPVHSAIAALHPQAYQPSSPESNISRSEHGSPRYASQGLSRHTSNSASSRFMRPSAYEQYGVRPLGSASAFSSAADAAVWEGLDTAKMPSPGPGTPGSTARATAAMLASLGFPVTSPLSLHGDRSRSSASHLGSEASYFRSNAPGLGGASASSPAFSFGTATSSSGDPGSTQSNSTATASSSATQGNEASGATTPKEPVRFSVSTLGPLSPFSNTALNSSMSPYLSAFSNARDTPLVSSPRPSVPITPGGLTSFDLGGQWNGMRPPSRTVSRHNSLHNLNTFTTSQATSPQAAESSTRPGRSATLDRTSAPDKSETGDADAKTAKEATDTKETAETSGDRAGSSVSTSNPANENTTESGSGMDTPSRFAKSGSEQYFDGGALTPGPEAFLLRLQGGVQELRAGIHGHEISLLNTPHAALGSVPLGNSHVFTPSWDPAMFGSFGSEVGTPGGPQGNTLSWLMSPNIQQLLNAFSTTSGTGVVDTTDKSDYFNSKTIEPAPAPPSAKVVEVAASPLDKALSDSKNPFYIPPNMFRACYSILHWNLPPVTRLSVLALHAQQNLLKHFPIIHEPTFRLDSTPACVTFGICMLGGHEVGRKWWAGEEVVPKTAVHILNSVTQPDRSNFVMQKNLDQGPSQYIDEEDGQELVKPLVMSEKMDMLLRTFAAHCKSAKDKYSVVQTMLLFQGNNFLSSDAATRTIAGISNGTVVALARQAGYFEVDAHHATRPVTYTTEDLMQHVKAETLDSRFSVSLPSYLPTLTDDDHLWRRWVELEGRRRTAFMLYTMDTVANLDAEVPTLLATEEICHLPLPTPNLVWRAPTSGNWTQALALYDGLTLDEALQQLMRPENPSPLSDTADPGRSIYGIHGRFARLVMMVALLRGIVDLVEGRASKVAKPSSLGRWLRRASVFKTRTADDVQLSAFKQALARWRKAWDQDATCQSVKPRPTPTKLEAAALLSDSLFTPLTASGATSLSDDALPLYWLSHVLVTHAASDQKLPLRSAASVIVEERNGEAPPVAPSRPDYRAMLRFAKNFVTRGEK